MTERTRQIGIPRLVAETLVAAMAAGTIVLTGCQGSFALRTPFTAGGGAGSPTAPSTSAPSFFAGTWVGAGYTCTDGSAPPEEQVRIALENNVATATKITGDSCVPAAEVTWRGAPQGDSFPVQVQVGRPRSPRTFVAGRVTRRGPDSFELTAPGWSVTYRRAEGSTATAAAAPCDIRQVEWKNFTFPDHKPLHNGVDESIPEAPVRLESSNILYADMIGDGGLEAFVPVDDLSGEANMVQIFVYRMDGRCMLRYLGKTGGFSARTGHVAGGAYIFERTLNDFVHEERVEVRFIQGRFMEAKVTRATESQAAASSPRPAATPATGRVAPSRGTIAPAQGLSGLTMLPQKPLEQAYADLGNGLDTHPEVSSAVKRLQDVFLLPDTHCGVRLSDGREFLLISAVTSNAEGSLPYGIAYDRTRKVAFMTRGYSEGRSPEAFYGSPDAGLRPVLSFVAQGCPNLRAKMGLDPNGRDAGPGR